MDENNLSVSARELPHSIEAEQALLSCMLLEPRVAMMAAEELRTEDFYRETHKLIYGAIQEIVDKHQELNLVSLIDLLKLKGQLADAGDVAYITHLSMARPTTAGRRPVYFGGSSFYGQDCLCFELGARNNFSRPYCWLFLSRDV